MAKPSSKRPAVINFHGANASSTIASRALFSTTSLLDGPTAAAVGHRGMIDQS